MGSTIAQSDAKRDFEIIWQDGCTGNTMDMDNVSISIYHYEGASSGSVTVNYPEPYIITEGINDVLGIATICPSTGYLLDEEITLDLGIIATDPHSLGCPPNDYTVPLGCTTTPSNAKVSIINGYAVYALSACELASLVNMKSSGFTADSEEGFLILTTKKEGAECALKIGTQPINLVLGLNTNEEFYGNNLRRVYDLQDYPMERIASGTYVVSGESLNINYQEGERYYVVYTGYEPVTGKPFYQQEDFTISKKLKCCGLNVSFGD